MKKKSVFLLLIVLILIAAAAAAVYYFFFRNVQTGTTDKIFVQSVEALQSYSGYGSRYSGVVDTQKSSKTEFDPEKKLKELFVSVGDSVKVGDPLFSYDTEIISLEIDQLNLEIERLNTENTNNTTQIELLSKDWDKLSDTDKLDYSAQIAQMQADIAQNEYDIRSKESEIRKKQASIENATVLCEMDGTVKEIADVEEIIAGTNLDDSGMPSNNFITIIAEGTFRIKGKVSETNIADIYTGMEVLARSRTDESLTWTGMITLIDTQTTASESSTMYYYDSGSGDSASKYVFYVELDSTEGLIIGQHVTLEPFADTDITSEGIWLDSGWIETDESGNTYVWAAKTDGARLEKRMVETGRYLEETDQTEILTGLSLTDYLAWPDDSCTEGAPTTSEYIIPQDEETMDNEDYPSEMGNMPDDMITEEIYEFPDEEEISFD